MNVRHVMFRNDSLDVEVRYNLGRHQQVTRKENKVDSRRGLPWQFLIRILVPF